MNANEYLERVLTQQSFGNDDPEMKELRDHRKEIENTLSEHFSKAHPTIRWGGSMAKKTMVRESYDGDMICYFPHDEVGAGSTLEDIFDNVAVALETAYSVERKTSALRVRDPSTRATKGFAQDLHIDVVPGRFTSDEKHDVFLHRSTGDKERLKTNLQVHIDHIRDSGVRPAIRLMKLWNVRNGIEAKTFVLELLVVKLLQEMKDATLDKQLELVWTEFRDNAGHLTVEDPANPRGNDLKPSLDGIRDRLSSVAATALLHIEESGWQSAFGDVDDVSRDELKQALKTAAGRVTRPTRPWCPDT